MENRTGALAEGAGAARGGAYQRGICVCLDDVGVRARALGIFHTSNPKRAAQILNESASSAAAPGRSAGRRPLHSR